MQPAFKKDASRSFIGVPLDTVSVFVLEYPAESDVATDVKVVPAGQVGELAVGGFQLARGYINRPEQTSAAFIDSPWGRLYRTGDKARILSNGTIEFLGRMNDAQVKLNLVKLNKPSCVLTDVAWPLRQSSRTRSLHSWQLKMQRESRSVFWPTANPGYRAS